MNRKSTNTLSDKISNILSTTPALIDPEDDIYQETRAKVVQSDVHETIDDQISKSLIRNQNLELLENVDKRYAGKRNSRKNIQDSDNFSNDSSVESSSNSVEESANEKEKSDNSDDDITDSEHSFKSELTADKSSDSETENDQEVDATFAFKADLSTKKDLQIQKGNSVKNQLYLWEKLLEMRIKLQKCLITSNKLPQSTHYSEIIQNSEADLKSVVSQATNSVKNILNDLLDLQLTLLKSYPETTNINKSDLIENIENEEILSDTEDENVLINKDEVSDEPIAKKCKTLQDYENTISKRHNDYKNYRNGVICKWNEKTRMSVAKNLVNSNSVINQIDYILKDRDRCIKRTQTKRSNYKIVGLKEDDKKHDENYSPEIFDDDDFYHQLLRELIEFKSSDVTDPVKLSRQWIQLQNMRSKMKRHIDTRATKGRKIRYTVHSKLVNYMAPIPDNQWTEATKNELYSSLFGRKVNKKK